MTSIRDAGRDWTHGLVPAVILGLESCWFIQPVPLGMKLLAAALLAASVWRPAVGLLIFAGLAPVSTTVAGLLNDPGLGARLLGQMALAAATGPALRLGATRTRIGAPLALMAAVSMASVCAVLPAQIAPFTTTAKDVAGIAGEFLFGTPSGGIWVPVLAGLAAVQSAAIAWAAEAAVRREPGLAARLVLMVLIGCAASAALDFVRVATIAAHMGLPIASGLATLRASTQTDLNAAGSVLVMGLIASFGVVRGTAVRRLLTPVLAALAALGLWVTGSRTAIVAGAIAIGLGATWLVGRRRRHPGLALAAAAIVLFIGAAWIALHQSSGRHDSGSVTVTQRLLMARIGLRAFERAPVFGIGVAQFYNASPELAGEPLLPLIGAVRENAHNNFIQTLAEQGAVGLTALLLAIGVVLVGAVQAEREAPDTTRAWLLLSVVAAVGTWVTGHPLLVPEFALVFWFGAGALCGLTPRPLARWLSLPIAVLAAVALVSIPFRAAAIRDATSYDHAAIGLTPLWRLDDSQRYREGGQAFALFLPAEGRIVDVPIRPAPGAPEPLVVDIRLRDRLVDQIVIRGSDWQTVSFPLPAGGRRFERVDFDVHPPPTAAGSGPLVRVGKDSLR